ncbi:hypothetical protein BD770DRAFT_441809 [Pilaira anomala]|nr:hypothetical protein BD770DRAFT_441809 [Pilaira anomala]
MAQFCKLCCSRSISPNQIVATLTGIQVVRALWQIWDTIDNGRPDSINDVILPTIYIFCILSTMLMAISVIATWSVYQLQMRTLNICWWLFYILTIFSFLNACSNLSIICLGKDDFMSGCTAEEHVILKKCNNVTEILRMEGGDMIDCKKTLPAPSLYECKTLWEDSVIWSAIIVMLDLILNLAFSYALYKCRVQYRLDDLSTHCKLPPPPYMNEGDSDTEEEDFAMVENK